MRRVKCQTSTRQLRITELKQNMDFVRKYKLNKQSHPALWFDPFVPTKAKNKKDFSIENCLRWTNVRAMMEGKYNDFSISTYKSSKNTLVCTFDYLLYFNIPLQLPTRKSVDSLLPLTVDTSASSSFHLTTS